MTIQYQETACTSAIVTAAQTDGELRSSEWPALRIIVPNLHRRYSGITSMVRAFLRHADSHTEMELVGHPVDVGTRQRSLARLVIDLVGSSKREMRVWHARRNNELVVGIVLRTLLRVPLKVVFTNANGRKKTPTTLWLLKYADAIIATSPEASLATERDCRIVPHGVDTNIYRPAPDRESAWASRGVGGKFGIAVFGRVRPQKGTDLFVDAMIRLLPRYPHFNAVVVGLAQRHHLAFRDAMMARIKRAGLADRIRFIGEIPANEVPAWLSSVSICVAPQRSEGFGLVPLEAAASGTVVVAAKVGAAASVVRDAETGYLVAPGDLDALTSSIAQLMDDDGRRRTMGEAARQHALRSLTLDREFEANLRVFRSLLA